MGCRVGITTDPISRKKDWGLKYPRMKNWKVSKPYSSRKAAQAEETRLAARYGCDAHYGGRDPDNTSAKWYVYRFNYR